MKLTDGPRLISYQQRPLILCLFTIYLFESFELDSDNLILKPQEISWSYGKIKEESDQNRKLLQNIWLRYLRYTTGQVFYLKSVDDGNSFQLVCASDPNYFKKLLKMLETESIS